MSWKKIGVTSAFVMAATIATASLQWVIMARIARQDGPATLGLYVLSLSVAVPLGYLSWLSIRQKYLILEEGQENMADFLFLRAALPAVVLSSVLLFIYFEIPVPGLFHICVGLFVLRYIEGFYDLLYAKMQKDGNPILIARTSIIRAVISAVVFGLSYSVSRRLLLSMLVTAVQQVLILLPLRKYLLVSDTSWDEGSKANFCRRLRLAVDLLPMSLSIVLLSFTGNAPRLLLGGLIGTKELGYYAAVTSFVGAGTIAASSIAQSILPGLSDAAADGATSKFWKRILWPMLLVEIGSLLGALVSIFCGNILMAAIYGKAFQNLGYMLVIGALSAGPIYMALIANNGLYALELRSALFWTQISTLLFTVFSLAVFTSLWGLNGVFIAVGLSGLFQTIVCIIILMRHWSSNLSIHIAVRRIGRKTMMPASGQ